MIYIKKKERPVLLSGREKENFPAEKTKNKGMIKLTFPV